MFEKIQVIGSRAFAIAMLALIQLLSACTGARNAQVFASLEIGKDYQGPVERIAFDNNRQAWMTTSEALYRVHGATLEPVPTTGTSDDLFALAPGGGIYARLVPRATSSGLFSVHLVEVPNKPIADLLLREFPFGFGTLFLGGAGKLIATASPLTDPEGLRGRFLYAFWSSDGRLISRTIVEGRRIGVIDVTGDTLLLLGDHDAIAFRNDGKQLWKIDGGFRSAAIASKGNIALLNPSQADAISEVLVFRDGTTTRVRMPSPVYSLAMAADGNVGAVAVDGGNLFLISPKACKRGACEKPTGVSLDSVSGDFLITAVRFIDPTTMAIGMLERTGTAPDFVYPSALALAMDTSGNLLFKTGMPIQQPATWTPSIDVTYGIRAFAAHTPERSLFVELGR
jgi:hypothetical protein